MRSLIKFLLILKMKKELALTIIRTTQACGICPEVWGNGKLPSPSDVNRAAEQLLYVRTEQGKFQYAFRPVQTASMTKTGFAASP